MIRGRANIERYFHQANMPVWKLYNAKGDMVVSHTEGTDVQVGWTQLGQMIDLLEPGTYKLTVAPSFGEKDTRKHLSTTIILGEQVSGAAPSAPGVSGPVGIAGYGIGEIIDMRVENALLKHKLENMATPPAPPSPLEKAIGTAVTQILPYLPAILQSMRGGKARPTGQQQQRQKSRPAQPQQTSGAEDVEEFEDIDDPVAQKFAEDLQALSEDDPDFFERVSKLRKLKETDPDSYNITVGMLDTM